ncbi:MAG: hypothetical protein ACKV22_06200, partial [Bryobacteraceae bacterium]
HGSEQKRAADADVLKSLLEDSSFEGLDVQGDIGKFRHRLSRSLTRGEESDAIVDRRFHGLQDAASTARPSMARQPAA